MLVAQGIEWADAMHLTNKPPGAVFVSLGRSFVRRAKRAGIADISQLLIR